MGGPESVFQFLDELDRRNVRCDQNYEAARFIQIVGEFFDQDKRGGCSLGVVNGPKSIDDLDKVGTDHGDNGFYVVSRIKNAGGFGRKVRRFFETPKGESWVLTEDDEPSVKNERKTAYASDYMTKVDDEGHKGFRHVWGDKPVEF